MARAKKSAPRQPRSVWEDTTVTDNPDAPAFRKEMNSLKRKRRALNVIAFGAVPAMLILGAGMFAQASTPTEVDNTAASIVANGSAGKAEAFRTVQTWLNSTPSPLPGGEIVSWDGFTREDPPAPTGETESVPAYTFESHTFTLSRGSAMFHATVHIVVDNILGASAMANPSLDPIAEVDAHASNPWFTLQPTTASGQVQQAVDAWASAFTGGDADALHQIVQDRDTNRSYIPLQGVEQLIGAEINGAGAKLLPENEGVATDTIVVRVSLSFWWKNGKPIVGDNEQDPVPTPISYDLLVEHADTATPVVVAWGAPGSGPSLTAYQNAVNVILGAPGTAPDEDDDLPSGATDGDSIEGENE